MKKIQSEDNSKVLKEFDDYGKKTVMTTDNAAKLRTYLENVVTKGTGISTYIEGYHIAGKTGTAKSFDPTTGGYGNNQYISSFAGMVPANDPVATILVSVDTPDGSSYFASETAVPAAKELFTKIFDYLSIQPEAAEKK